MLCNYIFQTSYTNFCIQIQYLFTEIHVYLSICSAIKFSPQAFQLYFPGVIHNFLYTNLICISAERCTCISPHVYYYIFQTSCKKIVYKVDTYYSREMHVCFCAFQLYLPDVLHELETTWMRRCLARRR